MDPRALFERLGTLLSERPERSWPDAAVHHGGRLLLLVLLALTVNVLFPVVAVPDFPVLEQGMVAEQDIIARVGFPIYKSEDELSREREEAAAGVPPIFEYRPEAVEQVQARVDNFMARVDSAASTVENRAAAEEAVRRLLSARGFPVTQSTVDLLLSANSRAVLERSLERAIAAELPTGVAFTGDLEESAAPQIRARRDELEQLIARDSVRTQTDFYDAAGAYLPRSAPTGMSELQRLILIMFSEPTLALNREATEAARERARQAIPTVKAQVLQGERVIGAHEQIREREVERLRAYREHLAAIGELDTDGGSGVRGLGSSLYALALLGIFGLLLYYYRRGVYTDFRHVLLVSVLVFALVAAAAIIGHNELPEQLIPIAIPALIIAALWDGRMALNLALVLALLIGGQAPFGEISVFFTMTLAGAAAALSVRVVRRRAQTWVFAAIVAGAYAAAALTLGLLRSREELDILIAAGYGALSGIGSALVAMGFLPLLESFTRITTDQTLLELSDLNHPLLRRLSREAPGTFAHSLSVANLAEAAARAVDANPLLARVGVYYHDVGKIVKPQYFIENQPQGRNPHDKLKPSSSAAVVRNHIIEGLKLADEHNLPGCIRAFVAEHHGTQPISFFLERAREEEPDAKLDAAQFSYPGPRPQSKETAITMLADSVESATRALPDPTPERIRELIDKVVAGKLRQGQLDETPLTLRDLTDIKEAFASLLAGMYHHRIDYPSGTVAGEPVRGPGMDGAAAQAESDSGEARESVASGTGRRG